MGHTSRAQDSCVIRISLLTCSPGEELYSTFGHTAIRIKDSLNGTDIVYNYGTFEFEDPDFYLHFTQGKLRYYLSRENFSDFVAEYQADGRGVVEQELNLDCAQRGKLQAALFDNMRVEKRYYKYDFLFDNCTTRARDMVFRNGPKGLVTGNIVAPGKVSFRDNLHKYLRAGNMEWSELGIDILLGSKLDRPMTNDEAMFLPGYLEKALDSTNSQQGRLVRSRSTLLPAEELFDKQYTPVTTNLVFWSVLMSFSILAWFRSGWSEKILNIADVILYVATGLLGLLLLFMWFGTEHQTCKNNYNLLWALPTHLIFAFLLNKRTPAVKRYFFISSILAGCCIIMWFIKTPQQLPQVLLPMFILLTWRSWQRAKA
jgi:Domain of unknown function (DUF4105)